MPLTEATINKLVREAAAKGKQLEERDPGCPGLELRVGKSGIRTWALRCRDRSGRLRNFVIGHHPAMGLSEARTAARRLRENVRDGADPTAARRKARAAASADPAPAETSTLEAVLDIYEDQRGTNMRSWEHSRKRVDRVFAALMSRPITGLTAIELQVAADRFPAKQSAAFAVRTLRPALRWAARRGLAHRDLVDIVQPVPVIRRRRVLSRGELADLLPVLMPGDQPYTALLYFLLLTLARRDEAASARWRDVELDRKTWRILETKNGEPHEVPLSRQAIDLLRRWGPGEPDALVFSTAVGTPLGNWDRATKRIHAESGTVGWHRHDLRRTSATMLGEMGEPPHVIEAALNHVHVGSPLAAFYNRSRYRPQVAAALQRLADEYDGIAAGAGEVVPLKPAR